MYLYHICADLEQLEKLPPSGENVLVLLTSEELKQGVHIPGLEHILCHTPSPRDARVCKAEPRHHCLSVDHEEEKILVTPLQSRQKPKRQNAVRA